MSDRPILYSAPMVRAILSGAKTQTRRTRGLNAVDSRGSFIEMRRGDDGKWRAAFDVRDDAGPLEVVSPFGAPGDRLWVREAWGLHAYGDFTYWHRDSIKGRTAEDLRASWEVVYAADAQSPYDHWRPSIHMPRWASRLTLEVTGVRVERLNAISEEDAEAEGVVEFSYGRAGDVWLNCTRNPEWPNTRDPREVFAWLWESINGPGSWELNPWVWVVEFERVTP